MTDHALLVAAFLVERPDDSADPEVLWAEMRRRWPGITREEAARGALIGGEILAGKIAEDTATLGAVEWVLIEKLAAAVQGWGEAEFQEIAAAAGIPLNAVREAIQSLQRGDPQPTLDDGEREEPPC